MLFIWYIYMTNWYNLVIQDDMVQYWDKYILRINRECAHLFEIFQVHITDSYTKKDRPVDIKIV